MPFKVIAQREEGFDDIFCEAFEGVLEFFGARAQGHVFGVVGMQIGPK
jgi:hypothetical protein